MADPFQDAQEEMDEQAKWGENRAHRAIRKLMVVLRILVQRVKALEDRMNRIDPPGK